MLTLFSLAFLVKTEAQIRTLGYEISLENRTNEQFSLNFSENPAAPIKLRQTLRPELGTISIFNALKIRVEQINNPLDKEVVWFVFFKDDEERSITEQAEILHFTQLFLQGETLHPHILGVIINGKDQSRIVQRAEILPIEESPSKRCLLS